MKFLSNVLALFIVCVFLYGFFSVLTGQEGIHAMVTLIVIILCLIAAFVLYYKTQRKDKVENSNPSPTLNVDFLTPIEYENYIAEIMKKRGYTNVHTTKATGDFGADILLNDTNGKKICVQCKRYSKPVGYKAVQEVYSAKAYYNCDEAWVVSTNGFTQNAKEGASKIGVKLFIIR